MALRTGSITPTMITHALNNAAIVLVAGTPELAAALDAHQAITGAVAVIGLTGGLALVFLRLKRMP
jgi:hypothetical protein